MKKILFLCGNYALPTDSNSVCVKNLAEEFSNYGNEIWIMTCSEGRYNNTIHIVSREKNLFTKVLTFFENKRGVLWKLLFKIIQGIRYFYTLPFYPNVAPLVSFRLYKQARKIIELNKIDIVVATYRPYETIYASIKLKKKYGEKLRVVTYHLDLLTSPRNTSNLILKTKTSRHRHVIDNEIKVVDKLLLPTSAPMLDKSNVSYVDFPLFVSFKKDSRVAYNFDKKKINITYVGTIDKYNRNPHYIINLLSNLPIIFEKQILLHIWGKISDISMVNLINNSKVVKYHGTAQPEDVPGILRHSDFLLNIGNAITFQMIPSKIFQYFASSKPIISIVRNRHDVTIPYFQKYGYTYFVKEYDEISLKEKEKSFVRFVENNIGIEIPSVYDKFESSTPQYICSQILL